MDESKIPTRADISDSDKWDLTHLFANVGKWQEDFAWLQRTYPKLQDWKGRVGDSAQTLAELLPFEKSLDLKIERGYHYASLQLAEDSTNNEYLARIGQVQNLLTKIGEAAAFVVPEILAINSNVPEFVADPALTEWRIKLRKVRRMKPHVLSVPEERLLALGSVALSGYDDTFSQLTDVDMKFGVLIDQTGRERPLTQSSFSSFLVKRDHELRKRAFHQFYAEFRDHQYTLAASLAYSVKADVFHARARHYSSALEATLFPDDVPIAVYDGLVQSVRANLKPLFRYFDLRRRALGLRELHYYDTYVPLVPEIETRFTFDQAVEMVLGALEPLGKEYVDVLAEGLRTGRWCDRYETKGKRSGAFSSGSYEAPPYMLMNYKEDVFADVYTLAHEAGHSMHSWFSQNSQRFQDYEYPIFLAEVASTFNEELLTHYLLKTTNEPKMRAYIINRQIDDLRGTLFRQTMFAEFEKIIHAIEESGDALTLDVFRSQYHTLLETYFAENFALDPELDLECLRIPHFYHAFYVYKYATGISAAVALSQRVLAHESGSVEAYLSFLRSGGSKFPLDTLKAAGVDMTTSAPIESTLRLFEQRLDELEELLL